MGVICVDPDERKICVLRPFQEYFTYIEPIIKQRWAKTGVPREKPPDLPLQNLASHMYPEQGSNHSGERSRLRVSSLNHWTTEVRETQDELPNLGLHSLQINLFFLLLVFKVRALISD